MPVRRHHLATEDVTTEKVRNLQVLTADIGDVQVTTGKIANLAVTNAKIANATLAAGKIALDQLQLCENIEAINDTFTAAADAIAVVEALQRIALEAEDVAHQKAAYLDLSYLWAATADGTIQLYDVTGAVVAVETATLVGAETSERARLTVPTASLVAGREYKIRVNVTVAGAAGETTSVRKATLKIVKRVS